MKKALVFASLVMAFAGSALAETRYISDRLEITMRSGQGTGYGITRMLRSGTPVELLEVDHDSGYSHVRTRSGKEGWVLSRFLMKGRAASDLLATAEKNLAELELENSKMANTISTLTRDKNALELQLNQIEGEARGVGQELAEIKRTASSALALDSENKSLKARVVSLERQMQTLQQENERLRDRTARDWFMVGAAVVLLGIITGLIIPRIRVRKKSAWDTF